MGMQLLLLLASLMLTHGQTSDSGAGLELGLIEVTHNACPPSHDCIAQEKCAHFQVKYCPAVFFGIISTKGALRLKTCDNHPIHPIRPPYSSE